MKTFVLLKDYVAPGNSVNGHKEKHFKKDDKVQGEPYLQKGPVVGMMRIDGGYLIPEQMLQEEVVEVAEVTLAADASEPAAATTSELPDNDMQQITDDFHDQLEEIKNTDIIQKAIVKSKNSVNGAMMGAALGLGVAIIWRKNWLISIVIGSVIGGMIGSSWTADYKKVKELNPPKQ